jgi:hypothetical protein
VVERWILSLFWVNRNGSVLLRLTGKRLPWRADAVSAAVKWVHQGKYTKRKIKSVSREKVKRFSKKRNFSRQNKNPFGI